jgi:hypothetical protein
LYNYQNGNLKSPDSYRWLLPMMKAVFSENFTPECLPSVHVWQLQISYYISIYRAWFLCYFSSYHLFHLYFSEFLEILIIIIVPCLINSSYLTHQLPVLIAFFYYLIFRHIFDSLSSKFFLKGRQCVYRNIIENLSIILTLQVFTSSIVFPYLLQHHSQ